MKPALLTLIAIVLMFCQSAAAQQTTNSATTQTEPPSNTGPADAAFVPVVESKIASLQLISATRRDPFIRIRLKNVSDKSIYAFRMRYHHGGAAILISFVMSDTKTRIEPGEVYRYDWPFTPTSTLAREPLSFEAAIFEDGSGDGDADKVKSLQDLFLTNMRELEHATGLLESALNSPNVETVEGLYELRKKVTEIPETLNVQLLNGLPGIVLPSWKGNTVGMLAEIERKKREQPDTSIQQELRNLKESYDKYRAKYPRTL
jgi:hypothetical protein